MKTRNYLLFSLAFALIFSLNACKSKQSNYKAAYEAAKARESTTDNVVDETTPVTKQQPAVTTTNVAVQREKVTTVDGAGIQQFSVVIGSFINKTNAVSLKERMSKQGYQAFLAQNESGMYRVIVATFSDKASAVAERTRIKNKYYSTNEFQDAWILDKQ